MLKGLKKQFKSDKKNLKNEYKEKNKNLKNRYFENIKLINKSELQIITKSAPKRGLLEEIGNATTHGVGALLSVVVLILMILKSHTSIMLFSAIVYFIGLFLMFGMSCLYHSFKYGSKVKLLFRRFDYSSIYLLIGATFVPILLIFVGGTFGIVFFIIQWIIIIIGVTFINIFGPHRFRKLHMTLYIILGWSGLLLLPLMIKQNIILFIFILGGGIVYSLGIIPFALKKKVSHFIWHIFVILGAAVQWIGIYFGLFM